MPRLLLCVLLVMIAGAAYAAEDPCGTYSDRWTACTQDSDCVIGATGCGGANTGAYNKSYLAEANHYAACIAPRINCLIMTPAHNPSDPLVCRQERCGFVMPQVR